MTSEQTPLSEYRMFSSVGRGRDPVRQRVGATRDLDGRDGTNDSPQKNLTVVSGALLSVM